VKCWIGTEKRKGWKERSLPKPSELGLISGMKFQSTAKTGKIVLQKGRIKESANCGSNTSNLDNNGNSNNTNCDHSDTIPPQYRKYGV
jgi:hypothetical protein